MQDLHIKLYSIDFLDFLASWSEKILGLSKVLFKHFQKPHFVESKWYCAPVSATFPVTLPSVLSHVYRIYIK